MRANLLCRDYDPSGPVGPTAFWKISDRQPGSRDDRMRSLLAAYFSLLSFDV